MRKKLFLLFGIITMGFFIFQGCDNNPAGPSDNNPPQGMGQLQVKAMDTPIAGDVTEVNLHIKQVSIHRSAADANDSTAGWITLANTDTVVNFLALINGSTTVLADTALDPGHYDQLRLLLGSDNEIVVDGITFPLTIPSGTQTGVKLNLDFDIQADETYQLYLDFNASHSIHQRGHLGTFMMRPTFHAFMQHNSGRISGMVTDSLGTGIEHASVYAVANDDTTATLTDSTGNYTMILEEGTYNLSAEITEYTSVDTMYSDIEVNADAELTGYDFQFIQ